MEVSKTPMVPLVSEYLVYPCVEYTTAGKSPHEKEDCKRIMLFRWLTSCFVLLSQTLCTINFNKEAVIVILIMHQDVLYLRQWSVIYRGIRTLMVCHCTAEDMFKL